VSEKFPKTPSVVQKKSETTDALSEGVHALPFDSSRLQEVILAAYVDVLSQLLPHVEQF
jgi:hypothetical protein